MKRTLFIAIALVLIASCSLAIATGVLRAQRASVDTRQETSSYEYDDLHRLTRVTYADGTQIDYEYDSVGNRTSKLVVLGQ
jgi:YD repeat-containing protein